MSKLPNDGICLFYFQIGWGGIKQIQNMNLMLNMKDINKIESYVWEKNCNI
jgi:hypothetical protein